MLLQVRPASFMFFLLLVSVVALAAVLISGEDSQELAIVNAQSRPILVIDPGHGGADGGAVSILGSCESDINLEIAQMLKALADFTGTPSAMTRESSELDYPPEAKTIAKMKVADQKQRVEFINSVPDAVLISIHQNMYRSPKPRGPQAFYGREEGSEALAAIAQEYLNSALMPESRRVAAPIYDSIFLFKKINCPALLAECGFLSNLEEAQLLETRAYRLKIAAVLMCTYLTFVSQAELT